MYNDFDKEFERKRKRIKRFFIGIAVVTVLIAGAQLGMLYFGYTKIEENGGIRATLVDLLREANKIQKEAEVESVKK